MRRYRQAASALNFSPSACTTFMMVANSGLLSAESALQESRLKRHRDLPGRTDVEVDLARLALDDAALEAQ